jgi:hypothetical protein
MRAVWSFWTKPFEEGRGWPWRELVHHWLAWGLSLRLARAHYPRTVLITDSAGKELLVERLGLSFSHVSTELDRLRDADPALWALGKLVAYSLQDEPFLHLDTDVFLWRPLPDSMTGAPMLAQHPEEFAATDDRHLRIAEDAFGRAGLSLPAEWQWTRSQSPSRFREANCGIVGGMNVGFLRHYAERALDLVLNPRHAAAWASIPDPAGLNTAIEQFFLVACLNFHRFNPASPHRGVYVRYLFPSAGAAFDPACATRVGFTHLLGPAKQNEHVTARLGQRMRAEDPAFYRRCLSLSGADSAGLAVSGG